jgi:hypothetical protein
VNDQLTLLLHDRAARLDVRLVNPDELRRAAQHKRAMRRTGSAALAAVTATVLTMSVPLIGGSNHTGPDSRTNQTARPSATYPDHFAILPPVGTPVSLPADGRLVLKINSQPGSWSIYADGRIIGGGGQRRLTPQGVQLLVSRVLAIGRGVGLFRQSLALGNASFEQSQRAEWFQVCNAGHLLYAQVLPPSNFNSPPVLVTAAQMHALDLINRLAADPSPELPPSAWADRTIRPYIPATYLITFDRRSPDPSQLPSPAKELLAQFQPLLRDADQNVTSDQARALIAAFVEAGEVVVGNDDGELSFDLPAANNQRTVLEIRPNDPISSLPDDRC